MTTNERKALLEKKARVLKALIYATAAFLVAAVGMTLVVLLLQNQRLDAQGRILLECTTPPMSRTPPETHPSRNDCFVRSGESTKHVLQSLNDVSIAAAACGSANPGNVAATRKCVEKAIKGSGAGDGK